MKPLAIFHVVQVAKNIALYFSLISDYPTNANGEAEDGDDHLPVPFKLGPYLFGKNRVSLLTFGRVEIRIRRFRDDQDFERSRAGSPNSPTTCTPRGNTESKDSAGRTSRAAPRLTPQINLNSGEAKKTTASPRSRPVTQKPNWYFEVTNGLECIQLDANSPFVLFSVLENSFEKVSTSRRNRVAQIAELALLAGDCMTKLDPALTWIANTEIRHHVLYQFSSTHWKLNTSEIMGFLKPIRQVFVHILQHDPEAPEEKALFDDVLVRSRVTFALLSECALFLWDQGKSHQEVAYPTHDLAVVYRPQLLVAGDNKISGEGTHGRLQVKTSTDFVEQRQDWDVVPGEDDTASRAVPTSVPSLFLSKPVTVDSEDTDDVSSSSADEVSMSGDFAVDCYQSRGDLQIKRSWSIVRTISMFSPYSEATTSGSSKTKTPEDSRILFRLTSSIEREASGDLCFTLDEVTR